MDVAITGTPGVGKTSLAERLEGAGTLLSLNNLAVEHGCSIVSPGSDEMEVDVSSLAVLMAGYTAGLQGPVFIDGHLSHHLPVDLIIVLRLEPGELRGRLEARGYRGEKIDENVEAEAVGVCLSEAVETGLPVVEIDVTGRTAEELYEIVMALLEKYSGGEDFGSYSPGSVDWLEGNPWV